MENIVNFTLDPKNPPKVTKQELERIDTLAEQGGEDYYSDLPELGEEFFQKAKIVNQPVTKKCLTIWLDDDILSWLKSQGKGYQTRVNEILRLAMEQSQSS